LRPETGESPEIFEESLERGYGVANPYRK